MHQSKFAALQNRCLNLYPAAILKFVIIGAALLNLNTGWAAGIEGQTFKSSVPLADGKNFPLPDGEWMAAVDVNYKDENGTAYNGRMMLNADANAFIPFIIIRQTVLDADWKKTDCDFLGNDQYLVDTFGTGSSDALAKCSHSATQYNYASLLNNKNSWWSPFSSRFPQIPLGRGEQLITSTNQIKKLRGKVIRYEVFMRPEKIGVAINDIMSADSAASTNSVNAAFRALNKKFIDAVSESVYGGKSVDVGDVSVLLKAKEETIPVAEKNKDLFLLERDVAKGDLKAMKTLADYYLGKGDAANVDKAISLYRTASDRGECASSLKLGQIHFDDTYGNIAYQRSKTYFEIAAKCGSVLAKKYLGDIYQNGLLNAGVNKKLALVN